MGMKCARFWREVGAPKMRIERLDYPISCRFLQQRGFLAPDELPPLPARIPKYDDDVPFGLRFFRTFVGEDSLDNLTIPRTLFGRSDVREISFRNTDLTESSLCWNDFTGV